MKIVKKNNGQIQVNVPKTRNIEAVMSIAYSNEQIAVALKNAAESNVQLAKALQVSPNITITGCSITSNGQFDTGINIQGEGDCENYYYDLVDEEECEEVTEDETENEEKTEYPYGIETEEEYQKFIKQDLMIDEDEKEEDGSNEE